LEAKLEKIFSRGKPVVFVLSASWLGVCGIVDNSVCFADCWSKASYQQSPTTSGQVFPTVLQE